MLSSKKPRDCTRPRDFLWAGWSLKEEPKLPATISQNRRSIVGVSTWVAHRNKDIFGEDAETFRPERWIENPEKVVK
ncbi:hypothetical protein DPV78_002408 [Talaromyces pinophilus]|nr:hypothetical protein DPV78_002408 [Talaromyces pinophilus]